MTIDKKKMRNSNIDAGAGLCLIYMMVMHAMLFADLNGCKLHDYWGGVMFFFMPYFFCKSGMFISPKHKSGVPKEVIKKNYQRLIVPFILFSFLGYLVQVGAMLIDNSLTFKSALLYPLYEIVRKGAYSGNAALWFLLVLFVVRVIAISIKEEYYFWSLVVSVVLSIVSAYLSLYNFSYLFGSIPIGMTFLLLGYYINKYRLIYNYRVLSICLVVFFAIYYFDPSSVNLNGNMLDRGHYVSFILSSIAGIIILPNIFNIVPQVIKDFFACIGRESMIFYVWHWIVLVLADYFLNPYTGGNNILLCSLLVISMLFVLPLLFKFSRKYLAEVI